MAPVTLVRNKSDTPCARGEKECRRMKRRFLSLLLAALMLCSLLPATALAADEWELPDREMGYDGKELPTEPKKNGNVWTVNPDNAQYTLDGAYGSIDGKTIRFDAGTYTDVLVLARPTKYVGSETKIYKNAAANAKEVEYSALTGTGVFTMTALLPATMSGRLLLLIQTTVTMLIVAWLM